MKRNHDRGCCKIYTLNLKMPLSLHLRIEFLTYLNVGQYCLHSTVEAQPGAVQGQIIIQGILPFFSGIILIITGPVVVCSGNELHHLVFRLAVDLHGLPEQKSAGAWTTRGHSGHFLQDMVGASSDQDAGAFLCQLADNLGLVGEQVIVFCEAGAFRGEQLIAVISAPSAGRAGCVLFFHPGTGAALMPLSSEAIEMISRS